MRIQRPPQRRSNLPLLTGGCFMLAFGCLACVTISILLLLPALPDLGLRIAGFQPGGSTEQLFDKNPSAPPAPIQNPAPPPAQAILEFGAYGQTDLLPAPFDYDLAIDSVSSEAQLIIPEASLNQLCHTQTQLCSTSNNQLRNATIDLKPGAAIINADFLVPQLSIWQALGIVVQPQNLQLHVVGVDIDGVLYQSYNDNIASLVNTVESQADQLLNQLVLNTGNSRYNLTGIYIDENALTLILR